MGSSTICIVLVLIAVIHDVSSFILPPPPVYGYSVCPGTAPCHCSGPDLTCHGQHLTSFPHFKTVNASISRSVIDMSSNQLTTVPANAFQSITYLSSSPIQLTFANNKLVSIEANAFRGLESRISSLTLNNNLLTSIPVEVSRLTGMGILRMYDNPLRTLGSNMNALHAIGSHASMLYLDFGHFTAMSPPLSSLSGINMLTAKHFNVPPISDNIFDNFDKSFTNIIISDSTMSHIPDSVCRLPGLYRLAITHNIITHMTSNIFRTSCSANRLLTVDLQNNGITSIPNDITSSTSQISTIHLEHNSFTSFPRVLNVLKKLSTIQLGYNSITSLTRADLGGLTSLSGLYISNNPITYISADAFANNQGLESLALENSQIRTVPSSLVPLPKFRLLYLKNAPLVCSCSAMSYLKPFKSWRYQLLRSTCPSTGMDLDDYIRGPLQSCH